MGCRGGLFYKNIDKIRIHPNHDLQQRCLSQRLSKTQAWPVQVLFVRQLLLSWTAQSSIANLSNSVVPYESTHVKGPQSVECALVSPRVELSGEVSFIVVFSNDVLAIFGWIRCPSLRTSIGTRKKASNRRGMVSLPRTSRSSNWPTTRSKRDHSKCQLAGIRPLSRRCRGD